MIDFMLVNVINSTMYNVQHLHVCIRAKNTVVSEMQNSEFADSVSMVRDGVMCRDEIRQPIFPPKYM